MNGEAMKNQIEIKIRVPNQTRYLRLIGNLGENMAREISGLSDDRDAFAYNINVVLTEAMSNAIKHANAANPDKDVTIRITVSDTELAVRVYDNGLGFDPNSVPIPGLNTDCLSETGRGLFIIRSLMDSVVYRKADGGNVLEMRKSLKIKGGSTAGR